MDTCICPVCVPNNINFFCLIDPYITTSIGRNGAGEDEQEQKK